MREARYVSLIPRTTLHSDSEQYQPCNSKIVKSILFASRMAQYVVIFTVILHTDFYSSYSIRIYSIDVLSLYYIFTYRNWDSTYSIIISKSTKCLKIFSGRVKLIQFSYKYNMFCKTQYTAQWSKQTDKLLHEQWKIYTLHGIIYSFFCQTVRRKI